MCPHRAPVEPSRLSVTHQAASVAINGRHLSENHQGVQWRIGLVHRADSQLTATWVGCNTTATDEPRPLAACHARHGGCLGRAVIERKCWRLTDYWLS